MAEAATKAGITLDEMADLVQRAMKLGATGREVLEVNTRGFGATVRLKTARVTIADVETADRP